jgi:signal transduction histidine kinase
VLYKWHSTMLLVSATRCNVLSEAAYFTKTHLFSPTLLTTTALLLLFNLFKRTQQTQRGRRQAAAKLEAAQADVTRLQHTLQSERTAAAASRQDMVSCFMSLERVVLRHQAALGVAMRDHQQQQQSQQQQLLQQQQQQQQHAVQQYGGQQLQPSC